MVRRHPENHSKNPGVFGYIKRKEDSVGRKNLAFIVCLWLISNEGIAIVNHPRKYHIWCKPSQNGRFIIAIPTLWFSHAPLLTKDPPKTHSQGRRRDLESSNVNRSLLAGSCSCRLKKKKRSSILRCLNRWFLSIFKPPISTPWV